MAARVIAAGPSLTQEQRIPSWRRALIASARRASCQGRQHCPWSHAWVPGSTPNGARYGRCWIRVRRTMRIDLLVMERIPIEPLDYASFVCPCLSRRSRHSAVELQDTSALLVECPPVLSRPSIRRGPQQRNDVDLVASTTPRLLRAAAAQVPPAPDRRRRSRDGRPRRGQPRTASAALTLAPSTSYQIVDQRQQCQQRRRFCIATTYC